MNVILLGHTPEPEKMIAASAKLCYSKKASIEDLMGSLDTETAQNFVRKLMAMHHMSPVEHATFTFGVEGVSRSLLAQATRHRIASYSVRSQRYCSEEDFEAIMPDTIYKNEKMRGVWRSAMADAKIAYNELIALGAKNEDARSVLPNACATRYMFTMNARELMCFFNERCCLRSQAEIRKMANEMLRLCKEVAPVLFEKAGASCVQNGFCPEGKMCCGKAPTIERLLEAYDKVQEMKV